MWLNLEHHGFLFFLFKLNYRVLSITLVNGNGAVDLPGLDVYSLIAFVCIGSGSSQCVIVAESAAVCALRCQWLPSSCPRRGDVCTCPVFSHIGFICCFFVYVCVCDSPPPSFGPMISVLYAGY